jgi:DNA-binding NtrC family response regulator
VRSIDSEALKLLLDYDWPGNVRELQNVLERAMNRCFAPTLTPEHFYDFPIRASAARRRTAAADDGPRSLREIKRDAEICAIKGLLHARGLSCTEAASVLGISRQMLHRKLRDYDIDAKNG